MLLITDDVLLVLNPKARFEHLVSTAAIDTSFSHGLSLMRLIDALCLMKRFHDNYLEEKNLEYAYMYGLRILSLSKAIILRDDYRPAIASMIDSSVLTKEFYRQMEETRSAINETYERESQLLGSDLRAKQEKIISSACK
uniref:USP8_dimer domain-containing protein n=1 Tax=Steinernema glaseri TaxID=37863 RepID=A0A1I7Y7R2_9BILA